MPDMGKLLLPTIVAIAFGGVAYVRRSARASSRAQSAPPSDAKAPVIRFVKSPEPAPPLPDHDVTGAVVSRANWNGKVVLVNFWATWCPPCREEIPEMIALQSRYKDQLQIVGISEDDDTGANVLKFAQQRASTTRSLWPLRR